MGGSAVGHFMSNTATTLNVGLAVGTRRDVQELLAQVEKLGQQSQEVEMTVMTLTGDGGGPVRRGLGGTEVAGLRATLDKLALLVGGDDWEGTLAGRVSAIEKRLSTIETRLSTIETRLLENNRLASENNRLALENNRLLKQLSGRSASPES